MAVPRSHTQNKQDEVTACKKGRNRVSIGIGISISRCADIYIEIDICEKCQARLLQNLADWIHFLVQLVAECLVDSKALERSVLIQ